MALTDVDICNLALSHIGQGAITLAEYTGGLNESARHLKTIYDSSRDNVLRMKDWRFASVKEALVVTADNIPGWAYIYTHPAKCLHINKIFYDVESQNPDPIEFEVIFIIGVAPAVDRKVIATNYDDAYIDYVYQVTDPALFDTSFVTAFSYFLAAQIAKPLANDNKMAELMMNLYRGLISDAGRINNSEKHIKPKQTSSFEDVR